MDIKKISKEIIDNYERMKREDQHDEIDINITIEDIIETVGENLKSDDDSIKALIRTLQEIRKQGYNILLWWNISILTPKLLQ